METFYIVNRFMIKAADGTEVHSSQKYTEEIQAKKRYYTVLASTIDSEEYSYSLCHVLRSDGMIILSQVFDNRVAPVEESIVNEGE